MGFFIQQDSVKWFALLATIILAAGFCFYDLLSFLSPLPYFLLLLPQSCCATLSWLGAYCYVQRARKTLEPKELDRSASRRNTLVFGRSSLLWGGLWWWLFAFLSCLYVHMRNGMENIRVGWFLSFFRDGIHYLLLRGLYADAVRCNAFCIR